MKVFAATLLAFAAVVRAADVPKCDSTKLTDILAEADATTCEEESGFNAIGMTVPTGDDIEKVCGNKSCQKLLASILAAEPEECIALGSINLHEQVLTPIMKVCEPFMSGAGGEAAGSGAETPAPVDAGSNADAAGSDAPVNTTAAPVAGSADDVVEGSDAVDMGSDMSTSAEGSDDSAASSIVAAAGAVVVAAFASLF